MEFHSFRHLINHATHIALATDAALHEYLSVAVDVIYEGNREMFGEYQAGAGAFQTWPSLAPSTKEDRERLGFPPDEPLLRTGKLRDSYYKEVNALEGGVGSDSEIALAQEVGDPRRNLPARSTLGLSFVRSEKKAFERSNELLEGLYLTGAVRRGLAAIVDRT